MLTNIRNELAQREFALSPKAEEVIETAFLKCGELYCDVYSEGLLYSLLKARSIAVPILSEFGIDIPDTMEQCLQAWQGDSWEVNQGSYEYSDFFLEPAQRKAKSEGRKTIYAADILTGLISHGRRVQRDLDCDGYAAYEEILRSYSVTSSKLKKQLSIYHSLDPFSENAQMCLTIDGNMVAFRPFDCISAYKAFEQPADETDRLIVTKVNLLTRSNLFLEDDIGEFKRLFSRPDSTEYDLQCFFEKHPKFLLGSEYTTAHTHVVLTEESGNVLIPDFFLEKVDSSFCDILDLKKANAKLITGSKNRRGFTRAVHDALNQLHVYRDFFDSARNRREFHRLYGLNAFKPRIVVVIGRTHDFRDEIERISIEARYSDLQILTYDDILRRAKRIAGALT